MLTKKRFVYSLNRCPYGQRFCIQRLSLNGDVFIGLHCRFCFLLLRNIQGQDTMFELTLDILLSQVVTNIEATLAGTCITFLCGCTCRDFFSCSSSSRPFGSLDGQITILQRYLDLIFLEAGQINDQLIAIIGLP